MCLVRQGVLLSWDVLESNLARLRAIQGHRTFVVRCAAKGCEDMVALNALLLRLADCGLPLLVDATLERLVALCALQDSCFVLSNVYPGPKVLVEPGSELQSLRAAHDFLQSARQFRGIRVVLTLAFDALPDLGPMLSELLEPKTAGLLRVLVLSPQRSPARLMAAARPAAPQPPAKQKEEENPFLKVIASAPSASSPSSHPLPPPSIDISAVPKSLAGSLASRDFFPASVMSVVVPLFRLAGIGDVSLRPHPLCGLVALLVPAGDRLVPISRHLDVAAFFAGMVPLLPILNAESANNGSIGWNTARKLRSVFQDSLVREEGNPLPEVLSLLASPEKTQEAQALLESAVLVMIHNNMDLMAFDMMRRCSCASVSTTPLTRNNLSAACVGCL